MSLNKKVNGWYRRGLYLRREWIAYYCKLFKQDSLEQHRVVIFGQGRTGSTLLEDLIFKTGHFQKHGELFHKSRGQILFPLPFIRGLARRRPEENFIFHVKIYQLVNDRRRPEDTARFLKALYASGWKIIYLSRRNKVKHVLSNYVHNARGASHKFNDKKEEIELQIDPEGFLTWVKERERFTEEEKKALQGLEYIEVVYEDDLEKQEMHQGTVDRILDELSLERKKVQTRHKKVNSQPLDCLIKNYDQFKKHLTDHGLAKYL
ncbi:sulfotransferase [Rhodohalobacter sp. SW132]|uniref:sulfotransferase n=1 Tax=Rhodohalobacter sp. SW132 TaxID=2293433 RepID=UPI0011C01A57|nr:sulfotransferase [Rhodohalobacter sp. SW132]